MRSFLWTTARWNLPKSAGRIPKSKRVCSPKTTTPPFTNCFRIYATSLEREVLAAQEWQAQAENGVQGLDSLLRAASARLSLDFRIPPESRALELINKTNQFNLNGRRFTDAEWQNEVRQHGAAALVAGYEDKFGPLGKILALVGTLSNRTLSVRAFVLRCRAFSRRIEHQCLQELFRRYELEERVFDYVEAPRNGPVRDSLTALVGNPPGHGEH